MNLRSPPGRHISFRPNAANILFLLTAYVVLQISWYMTYYALMIKNVIKIRKKKY